MIAKTLLRGCVALSIWTASTLFLQADPITFYLDSNSQITSSSSGVGNYIEYTHANGFKVTATAWYAADLNSALTAAKLGRYDGGLGVCSEFDRCRQPNHAVDNNSGKDFVLFRFSGLVDPYRMTLGWASGDADVQYWVGIEKMPALQGLLIGNLADEGFASYNLDEGDGTRSFNLLGSTGFSLLVAGQLSEYNDYFKIERLKLEVLPEDEVPEPATFGLVGASILGLVWIRRKRT